MKKQKARVIWVVCKVGTNKPVQSLGNGSSVFSYIKKERAEQIASMARNQDEYVVKFIEADKERVGV